MLVLNRGVGEIVIMRRGDDDELGILKIMDFGRYEEKPAVKLRYELWKDKELLKVIKHWYHMYERIVEEDFYIVVYSVSGTYTKLGFCAPKEMKILRGELV